MPNRQVGVIAVLAEASRGGDFPAEASQVVVIEVPEGADFRGEDSLVEADFPEVVDSQAGVTVDRGEVCRGEDFQEVEDFQAEVTVVLVGVVFQEAEDFPGDREAVFQEETVVQEVVLAVAQEEVVSILRI